MINNELLKAQKKQLKLSFDEIAAKTGCSRHTVINIINGTTPTPRIDTLKKIADVLDVPFESIYSGASLGANTDTAKTELSDDEKALVEAYRRLSPQLKTHVNEIVDSLAKL